MDLFDLLEKFFRGIVYFIYNLLETTGAILRRPLRGPVRMHLQYRRLDARQIGGLTYLFVSFWIFYWVLGGFTDEVPSASGVVERIAAASASMPSAQTFWPATLSALTSAVVIDAILRLILRLRLPRRRMWRQLLLAAAEYAFVWMLIAGSVWFILLIAFFGGAGSWVSPVFVTWTIVSPLGSPIPAAMILRRAFVRRIRGRVIVCAATAAIAIGVLALFALALYAGNAVGLGTEDRRSRSARPSIETLHCAWTADRRIEVEALIRSESEVAEALDRRGFHLLVEGILGSPKIRRIPLALQWQQPFDGRYLIISKAQPRLVRLRTAAPVATELASDCQLLAKGASSKPAVEYIL